MKLFKYTFKKWFKLNWGEIQNILSYAVTEKSIEELEEKQAVIQTQLNMAANKMKPAIDGVFIESNEHVKNLETMNNILGAAIVSKKFDK